MKRKQITAILLSAIMTVTACVPMNSISAFAAESSGAGNTETAAVVEMQEEEAPAEEAEPDTAVAAQEVQEEQSVEAEPAAEPEESGEEATETEPAVEDAAEEEEKAEAVVEDASEEEAAQNEEPAVEAAEEETAEPAAEEAPAAETAVEADDQAAEADQAEAADQKADTAKEAAVVEETTETDKQKDAKKSADSAAAGSENMMDLEVGGSCYVSVSEENPYAYLRITPNETADYEIYAGDAPDGDSYWTNGVLYNSDFESIANCSFDEYYHFQIEETLIAGRTYYLRASEFNYGSAEFIVYLVKKNDIEFYQEGPSYKEISYLPGEEVSLSVYAYSSNGEVEYSWTDADGNELAVNTAQFTYTPTGDETIYCNATDGSNSCSWEFYFYVSNDLQIRSAGYPDVSVGYGESCTLETIVSAKDMSQLEYQWYKVVSSGEPGVIIEGANESSFTIGSVVSADKYYCVVSDQYGESAEAYFYISVNNNLRVYTYAENSDGELYETTGRFIYVKPNETETLSVMVEADDLEGITYEWYGDYELIEGADSAEYTTEPVTDSKDYRCIVRDKYGNWKNVDFTVYPRSYYDAYILTDDGEKTNYWDVYATPNEAATLSVTVETDDPEGITFRWYKDYELIEGADSAEYTTEPVVGRADYYCHVEDKYGNSNDLYFYIYPENHFSAYTLEETGDGDYYHVDSKFIYVTPNDTTELSVIVEADDSEGITYTWYKDGELIEGADSSEYITEPVTGSADYYCFVRDRYENYNYIYFYVRLQNHFRAYTYEINEFGDSFETSNANIYVTPNETSTLSIIVEADDTEGITYEWHKDNEIIEGADSAEYTTEPVTARATYYCHVEDKYGNSNDIYFYVNPNNHFRAYAIEEFDDGSQNETNWKYQYVTPNETTTLSVIVEADDSEGITYTWYKNDELIEGADSAEYITEPVTLYNRYYCRVEDKYGSSSDVTFYVYPENHFRTYTLVEDEYGNQEEETWYADVFVTPNEPFTLSVIVEADDMDGITYSWEKDDELIEGADSADYTADPITGKVHYSCSVQDKYGNTGHISFNVYPQNHFRAYTVQDGNQIKYANLNVTPNETVTLSVTVEADDLEGITYSWLKNEQKVEGADSAKLITEAITGQCDYLCIITDKYGSSQYVDFYIRPENHFDAHPNWGEGEEHSDVQVLFVSPGETTTLDVAVEADDTEGITYTWYKNYYELIEGANAAQYTTEPVDSRAEYSCYVQDKYGNGEEVYFSVYVANHFGAYAEGEEDSNLKYLTCKPKENVTLQVIVEADDMTGLTYSWEKSVNIPELEEYSDGVAIEGADSDHYEVTAQSKERYACTVSDRYGNTETVWFYISVDNGFKVYPEGNTDGGQLDVTIQPGETATLRTIVEANDPEGITYRWEYYSEEIEGQNTDVYTGASKSGYYTCTVTDAYGNQGTAYFFVTIDNDFQLRQEGNSAIFNGTRTIYVQPGQESIDLNVSATATVQDGITYQWYKDYELIEGAEGTTYTADCDRDAVYECRATDAYGSEGSAVFRVIVNNCFSAYIDNGQQMETVTSILTTELVGKTLKVKAFAADMDNIHYQWELGIIDEGDYRVVGTDSDSYTIKEEDLNQEFNNIICTVTDGYGHEKLLRFLLEASVNPISETFSVYPEGAVEEEGEYNNSVNIYLRPSENEATLKVIATGAGAQGLSYKWSVWDDDDWYYRPIGENADTYRASVTGDAEYRCLVTNEEGESHVAWFYVNKDFINVRVKGTGSSTKTIELTSPGNVTLEVEAEASDPELITYEWYKDEEIIPNENGSSLSVNVTKSAVYECRVSDGDYEAHAQFFVQIGSLTASCGNSDFELTDSDSDSKSYFINATPGQTLTIPTIAESTNSGALTYKWTHYGELLSTNSSYSLQATESDYYLTCTVEDSLGNVYKLYYEISVNHFSAQAESETVYYNPDNSDGCILKVITAGDDLNNVEYKWYCWDNDQMIAQGTDSVIVNPGTNQVYYCRVKDAYGNYSYIDFDVCVDTDLKASPKDQTIGSYDAEKNLVTVNATEGQAVTLSTVAENVANTDITYIWYSHDLSDPNADMEEGWKFEDASGDTLSITADKSTRYNCIVVDKYGSSDTLTFDVYTSEIKTLQKAVITLSQEEYTYDGTQKMPEVTVTYQNTELTKGTDYEISYGSNTNAGEGTVTITGLGEFSDSDPVIKTFVIDKAQQSLSASDLSVVAGASEKIAVTGAQGELSYESDNTDVVTVENDGTVTAAVDAGGKSTTVKVTAAATENYESATISVAVSVVMQKVPQTISAEDITLEAGSSAKIAVTGAQGALSYVSDNTSVVTVGSDGTVTAAEDAGGKSTTVKVTAAATDSYEAATISVTVSVVKKKVPQTISAENITLEAGSSAKIAVTGAQGALSYESDNTNVVTVGSDGTVTAATDAAGKSTTVKVTAAATDDYEAATIPVTVSVVKKKAAQTISAENITLEVGSSAKIAVTGAQGALSYVSDNTSVVTVGTDGTVTAAAGAAGKSAKITVTAAGTDDYLAGSTTLTVSVKAIDVSPTSANASKLTATASSGLVYNGKEQKPAITVAYNGKALQAGTDYDVTYKETAHVNAGTYTVYVVCKGNYSGTKEVKYTIAKAAQAPTAAIGGVNAGRTGTFGVVNSFGTVTVASQNTGIATATISGTIVTVKGVAPGTATLSITAAGDGNHTAKTITCSVKVFPAATKTFKAANVTGKGIKLTWAQVAGANGYDIYRNNKKIKSVSGGSTKTYTDTGANTNGSKYTYKIYARAASGTSTLYKSVVIYKLSRPAVKSLSNSAAKKMTVKWAKNAKAKGYQIQYGLKSNFSGAKSTKITSFKTVSKVIGSLKKGKTYYVRIRTYKTVSGKTYYSAWSASKKLKINQ